MLHYKIKIAVDVGDSSEHKTSVRSCFTIGPAPQTVLQHSANMSADKSMCLLGPLNVFPFHKQIYIYVQIQKLIRDFWFMNLWSLKSKIPIQNGCQKHMNKIPINLS